MQSMHAFIIGDSAITKQLCHTYANDRDCEYIIPCRKRRTNLQICTIFSGLNLIAVSWFEDEDVDAIAPPAVNVN